MPRNDFRALNGRLLSASLNGHCGVDEMNTPLLLNCREHPYFNLVVENLLDNNIDLDLMKKARNSKLVHNESQAQALYVIFKLQTLNTNVLYG